MKRSMKQKQKQNEGHREQAGGAKGLQVGERCIGSLGLADENWRIYRMDQQKGPTVEKRELYSESCDKP